MMEIFTDLEQGSEAWRPVVGFEGYYEVSDRGRLRSTPRQGTDGRIIKITPSPCGYLRVRLYKNGKGSAKKMHRIVLEAFVGPCPPRHEGCHNDGDRSDCSLSNLRWDTREANCRDAKIHGSAATGEKNGQSKLTRADVDAIRSLRARGMTYSELSRRFNVAVETARSAAVGATWG